MYPVQNMVDQLCFTHHTVNMSSPTTTSYQVNQYQQLLTNLQLHKELTQPSKRKLKSETPKNIPSKVPRIEEPVVDTSTGRVYSNDMANACTHACHVCSKLVTLTGMRSHTKCMHDMPIRDYMEKYGNYREQLAKVVYHRCGVCQEEILLDGDSLHKHCTKHRMMMKEYTAKFIKSSSSNRLDSSKPSNAVKKATQVQVSNERGIWKTMEDIENILDSFSRNSD